MNGIERQFYDYHARGAPYGPDDGTVAPWVVVASLPFAPEIVIPTVRAMAQLDLGATKRYGFKPSFNRTYAVAGQPDGLVGDALPLRHRPGAGDPHDRELPHRADLGHHAPVSLRCGRTAPGGLPGRLALSRRDRAADAASARRGGQVSHADGVRKSSTGQRGVGSSGRIRTVEKVPTPGDSDLLDPDLGRS